MKVKEIDRTANTCWSPVHVYPIYLAAGTAGQQLDSSFSTSAALELYSLNLTDPGTDLKAVATFPSDERFYKLVWGTSGSNIGTLVGGCDHGALQIYNSMKLINNENGLLLRNQKHSGPVRALDFNTFQTNLLASGASESEIFIWDLNNPSTAMTPGTNTQPPEGVTALAWNKQVQHILAASFSSKCVVWDLRKNDPIIKLTDSTCRLRWSDVSWNPDIATQLCLTSEDDQSPIIQLWDLRFATSPVKVLEGHQKGVLSLSWSRHDSDMLLSCGKDNRILCWNPNATYQGGELICEMTSANQWNFSISWCPRHPALYSCCSFDGHVSVYSVVGAPQQQQTSTKIADSFPGMELYAQAPVSQVQTAPPVDLKKPPKWLKRPAVAKFGFGGKLIIAQQRSITVCQVTTEPGLVARANLLDAALRNANYDEYCRGKIASSTDKHEKTLWEFLAASFSSNAREQFLNLLGFHTDELTSKVSKLSLRKSSVSDRLATLGRSTDSDSEFDATDDFLEQRGFNQGPDGESNTKDELSDSFNLSVAPQSVKPGGRSYKISTSDDTDGLICEALLLGNTEAAVEICVQDERWADAIILAMTGGADLLAKTQHRYLQENPGCLAKLVSAVVTEDWAPVIENCDVSSWREALVAALTHSSEEFPALCEVLGDRLDAKNAQLCFLCAGNLPKLVSAWLSENNTVTSDTLQDLVEVIMFLRAAIQMRGRSVDLTGSAGNMLSQYAQILASEGNLEMALSYLETSQDEQVQQLKSRVYHSIGLGQQPQYQRTQQQHQHQHQHHQPHQQQQQQQQQRQNTFEDTPTDFSKNQKLNTFQPIQNQQSYISKPISTTNQYTPLNNHFPSESAAPNPVSSGLTSRPKHVVDPSVAASPYGMQRAYAPPIQPAFSSTPNTFVPNTYPTGPSNFPSAPNTFPSTGNYPLQQQPQPVNPTPPLNSTHTMMAPPHAQPPGWNDPPPLGASRKQPKQPEYIPPPITQPLFGAQEPKSAPNGLYDPYAAQNISYPGSQPPPPPLSSGSSHNFNAPATHLYNPTPPPPPPPSVPQNNLFTPADPVSSSHFPPPPGGHYGAAPPPRDTTSQFPPPLNTDAQFTRPSTSTQIVPPPQKNQYGDTPPPPPPATNLRQANPPPINQPFPGGLPPSNVAPPQPIPPQRPPSQNQLPPLNSAFPLPLTNNPPPVHGNQPGYTNAPAPNYPISQAQPAITEKQKQSIPEEHIHLRTVFDELRIRCIQAASNPQLKRKLDDVARKLDSLYDALAEARLSKRTLDALHEISQKVQNGDYTGGLNILTQLASGPDFSQISAFMPGIKILLQCALQLQVYL